VGFTPEWPNKISWMPLSTESKDPDIEGKLLGDDSIESFTSSDDGSMRNPLSLSIFGIKISVFLTIINILMLSTTVVIFILPNPSAEFCTIFLSYY